MGMEIGSDAEEVLRRCSNGALDADHLEDLAHTAVSLILHDNHTIPPHLSTRVCSALSCLFLEAAKNGLILEDLAFFLKNRCSFSHEEATIIASVFADKKEELTGRLFDTANHSYFCKLSGVEWKLDYCISSSEDRSLKEFLYHVCLKRWNSKAEEDAVQFVCSVEELQDLVSRLKDACKSVERTAEHH